MWSEEKIKKYLKNNLDSKRYNHSLSVMETSIKLAEIYGADIEKARLAGLIHDCAKNMSSEDLLRLCGENHVQIDEVSNESPQLLHGLVGAIIAEKIMGIEDKEILDAVTYHTTGRKEMTLLDEIIYIADYIEPLRSFPGVEELREISYKNLEKGLLQSFNNTIKFVVEKGQFLHLYTIEARNYIICKLEKEKTLA